MRTLNLILVALTIASLSGCAPFWQVRRIEDKVDRLVQNTNRATLSEIFGEQTDSITQRIETLGAEEKEQLDTILATYERGAGTLDEVRGRLFSVLGGGERVVSSARGIWVRNEEGKKIKAIARDSKIDNARRLEAGDLPETITGKRGLMNFAWGTGTLGETTVLFPWELTISAFTKEIVENTARRTAEQFIKMGGDKAFNRPINIKITTDSDGKGVKINYPGDENEIYVTTDEEKQEEG